MPASDAARWKHRHKPGEGGLSGTGEEPVESIDVLYDNTTSGSPANNAQDAIDDLYAGGGGGGPPTGAAGGVLSGTYPNPGFANDMATQAELDAVAAAKSDVGHGHSVSHASTTGQTPDDHHAKSHAHDGADGSGTVAYSALTSRSHGNGDHTTGVAAGNSAVGDTVAEGSSAAVARADHRHGRESFATPGSSLPGDAAAAGSATTIPRSDHAHGREFIGIDLDQVATSGTGAQVLATVSIPSTAIGSSRGIEVFAAGGASGVLGTRTVSIALSTISKSFTLTTSGDWCVRMLIFADGATNDQKVLFWGYSADGLETFDYSDGAADLSVARNLNLSGNCSNAADSITVEVLYARQIR